MVIRYTDLQEKIRAIEEETSAEVALVVLPRSISILPWHFVGILFGVFAIALLSATELRTETRSWIGLTAFMTVWALLPFIEPLWIHLIPRRFREASLRTELARTFFDLELQKLPKQEFVLVFVSRLEHQVFVLAGTGLSSKVKTGFDLDFAEKVSLCFKAPDPTDALLKVFDQLGKNLKTVLPQVGPQANLVPDTTIRN